MRILINITLIEEEFDTELYYSTDEDELKDYLKKNGEVGKDALIEALTYFIWQVIELHNNIDEKTYNIKGEKWIT